MPALGQYQPLATLPPGRLVTARNGRSAASTSDAELPLPVNIFLSPNFSWALSTNDVLMRSGLFAPNCMATGKTYVQTIELERCILNTES
jgi:hypothetical protein